ncbi:MAG: cysteine desulfurase NifS [bacterium]|nr:cysteine desulfurase NifS [bacterium]
MREVYLDHAATTPVHHEVAALVEEHMLQVYGNPSSLHRFGRRARAAMEEARERVARAIAAEPEEIVFTSGGTESNNLALKGVAIRAGRGHLITTQVEHHAVLHTCEALEKQGFPITYLPVDRYGRVTPEQVAAAITADTVLVSVMMANNEVGTIQPIAAIGAICRERGVLLHTDAVQSFGQLNVDVRSLSVDLLTLSGHKVYGPKGVGALYVRRGVRLAPLMQGGGHERKRRPGTENVPGIVGLGKAAELASRDLPERARHLAAMRDRLTRGIQEKIGDVVLNGHPTERLPNNANLCFRYVEGESVLLALDSKGIGASSGSACTSGALEPSHVLMAMGLPHDLAQGSVRFSVGRQTTAEDIDYVLDVLPPSIGRLRAMSPLYAERVPEAPGACVTEEG